jgi:hypothetical protein
MAETMNRFEFTNAQDAFFDFCLWEYKPAVPYENKFRSANLLFHSFDVMGTGERAFDLVRIIREGIGVSSTIWGVKQLGRDIRWEFYFYDYRKTGRHKSITKLLDIIRPLIPCPVTADESLNYFMFSVDLWKDLFSGAAKLEEIHMYIGNAGSTVSSGICYSLKKEETRLENFYFFFDAKSQLDLISDKISCSAYVDIRKIGLETILWPEMRGCSVIVVANKQGNDAVYFSRINVDQLISFMGRMNYPEELTSFVEANRDKLDHLQFDVGYDYRMEGSDLVILKSGYYGFF